MSFFPFQNLQMFLCWGKRRNPVVNELLASRIRFKLQSLALETHMVWYSQELQLHILALLLPLFHHIQFLAISKMGHRFLFFFHTPFSLSGKPLLPSIFHIAKSYSFFKNSNISSLRSHHPWSLTPYPSLSFFVCFYSNLSWLSECLSHCAAITGLLAFLLHQPMLPTDNVEMPGAIKTNGWPAVFQNKLWQYINLLNTLMVISNGHSLKLLCAQKVVFIYKDTEILLKAQW